MEKTDVVVIGASQAGLAVSYGLSVRNVDHIVLEKNLIANGWQQRWDSFCLVTPNWTVQLPGYPYDGDEPDGFMPRDDIVGYLQRYAQRFDAPVSENTRVKSVQKTATGFIVETEDQQYQANHVVMATGAFQKPYRPDGAASLPARLYQIDLDGYTNTGDLPEGNVLIVGSGQSGCQLAEEIHLAGRQVALACGRAPWSLRRIGDHDLVWWAIESGFLDAKVEDLPVEARLFANVLATGHDGGHDLHLRTLQSLGVNLVGRFEGGDENYAYFANDLAQSVAWGDEKYLQLKDAFKNFAQQKGMPAPDLHDPDPFVASGLEKINLAAYGSVIFTGGYRPDFSSLLPWPEAFDEGGFPHQRDGSSTVVDGLHFVGLHFLRKRKSALLYGVGEDATIVAEAIAAR